MEQTKRQALSTHIYVTAACNLHCKHCYYDAITVPVERTAELAITDVIKIVQCLCDNYDASIEVEGGEAFLRPDIGAFFTDLPEKYLARVTVTTNGTVPVVVEPGRLMHLRALRVSVEGHTDELHRRVRKAGLSDVLLNADRLLSAGVDVVARVTVSKANYEYVPEIVQFFSDHGFPRMQLFEFQSVGRGRTGAEEFCLGVRDVEHVLHSLSEMTVPRRLRELTLSLPDRRWGIVESSSNELRHNGFQLRRGEPIPSLTINANGELGVCPWHIGSMVIGKLDVTCFEQQVSTYMETGTLLHECAYCSAVRVTAGNAVRGSPAK